MLLCCETKNTALILAASSDETLQVMYYGARLHDPMAMLDAAPLGPALPVYGPGSRMEFGLRITHADGNLSTLLRFKGVENGPSHCGVSHRVITLHDLAYPVSARVHFRCYEDEDIIEQWVEIVNHGKDPVALHSCASFCLPLQRNDFYLTHFPGGWGREMRMEEFRLPQGATVLDSNRGTQATLQRNPAFMLSLDAPAREECGEVIAGALRWAGNWRMVFRREAQHFLHIFCGVNPFASSWRLASGETFTAPPMLATYSNAGKGCASRRFHRWARRYGMRHGADVRPVVQNSWEGTGFDFDEKTIASFMDFAAEMGVEIFVLDDGWFGVKYPRNDDRNGLGDWQVNRAKLPGGLSLLAREARTRSMKFGIWVEPEMVNPRSELYERHPEWTLRLPNREPVMQRNQLVLDLGNAQVQEFVFSVLDELLKDREVSFVKWDCNSPINNPGSELLDAGRQEEVWIRYVKGLETVLQRLREAYPDVLLQVCSSGGGRVEYGSLSYFDEFWSSDNTDALDRVGIQWGYSHFFPAIAMAAHVSASPNHFTGRAAPIKFRVDVAMAGRFGIELPPQTLTAQETEFIKKAVAEYKAIRDVIQLGDLYRLVSPYACGMASLMYVSHDRSRAVLFAYMLHTTLQQQFPRVRLAGLDAEARYRVDEISLPLGVQREKTAECTGDFLMQAGMPVVYCRNHPLDIALGREMDSAVFVLTRIKQTPA